jgi:G3E family GTPase
MTVTPSSTPLGVSLVSGFLGSGKTTFINRLLSSDHGVRMGVLVNDFGEIDIDGKLIVNRTEDTVTLANGCICCTLRDDLGAALRELAERDVEHVVVEASGIADPRVLARTFILLDRGRRVALDAVIVLVDSEQLHSYDPADLSLARDQLSQANVVLLNKIDLADEEALAMAEREVARFCPRAAVVRCTYADVPTEVVLGVGRFDPEQLRGHEGAEHEHAYRTWSFTCDEPLTLERLRDVATDLPPTVFRAKGLVHLRERPEHICVLQVVGRRARIDLGEPWGDRHPRTELVFLGRPHLDPDPIEQALLACTKPPSEPTVMGRALDWIRSRWRS